MSRMGQSAMDEILHYGDERRGWAAIADADIR